MSKYKEYLQESEQEKSVQTVKKAKELAKKGEFDKAWNVAKNDSTLEKGTTKEKWIKWVKGVI